MQKSAGQTGALAPPASGLPGRSESLGRRGWGWGCGSRGGRAAAADPRSRARSPRPGLLLGLRSRFVESGLASPRLRLPSATKPPPRPAAPHYFLLGPTFGASQGPGIPLAEFSVFEDGSRCALSPGADARHWLRVAALVKQRESWRRLHRTWLARPRAPRAGATGSPGGRRCPSALAAFCSGPTRRPGAPSRANGLEAAGSQGILLKRKEREFRARGWSGAGKPGELARGGARVEWDLRWVPRSWTQPACLRRSARLGVFRPRPRSRLGPGALPTRAALPPRLAGDSGALCLGRGCRARSVGHAGEGARLSASG